MGIFSWIFSKNTESNSHIRKWIATEIEKVEKDNPDTYALFIGLIHASVQWGKRDSEKQDEGHVKVAKDYLGDSTIFEIACYTYYRLESWLAKNYPELKTEITLPLSKWIIEKFYTTLYVDEQLVSQLFKEQLEGYTAAKDTEKVLEELKQRILMTKGDKFNKKDLPQDSLIDSEYVELSFKNYEELHLLSFLTSIKEYCEKNAKVQLSAKENREQKLEKNQDRDYLFGMALLAQKDWVRACKAFTNVLTANPTHYDSLIQRGLLHVILQQPIEAVQDFTTAIKIKPEGPAAYLHRAKCYHRKFRQKEKALSDYSMAIDLAPQDAAGYLGRGELYDEIALHHEKQALENKDEASYAHVSEEFLSAINDYDQTITLEPEDDAAYLNRALLYARKARVNKNVDFIVKSIADFEKAMSLNWENGYLFKQKDEMSELLEQITHVKK